MSFVFSVSVRYADTENNNSNASMNEAIILYLYYTGEVKNNGVCGGIRNWPSVDGSRKTRIIGKTYSSDISHTRIMYFYNFKRSMYVFLCSFFDML